MSIKKASIWFFLNLPLLVMSIALIYSPALWKPFTSYSGWMAIGLLIFLLSLNPLIKIWPTFPGLRICNRHRQELGVSSFFYALLHFICFIVKRGGWATTWPYLLHPALIPGLLALSIFAILSITSNKYSLKTLGFPKWKNIHRKVYFAEAGIIVHLFMTGHKQLMLVFIPLVIIQLVRTYLYKNKVPA